MLGKQLINANNKYAKFQPQKTATNKRETTEEINRYIKFSWAYRKQDIDKYTEEQKRIMEETGKCELYVEQAISWAPDIHPNGPEPSSVVTWIHYNGRTLSFGLRNGGSREYEDVDYETAFAFTESDSKGRFVYRNGL